MELTPKFTDQKSFYGKATMEDQDDVTILYSYGTKVAMVEQLENGNFVAEVYNLQSPTTTNHVKEFLYQHNFHIKSKADIEDNYLIKDY